LKDVWFQLRMLTLLAPAKLSHLCDNGLWFRKRFHPQNGNE
jgi:hypothetical protein